MATEEERQTAFDAAIDKVQQKHVRIIESTWTEIHAQLERARQKVVDMIAAGNLSAYEAWRLPNLLKQIDAALAEATTAIQEETLKGLDESWEAGIALVDEPFIAAGSASAVVTFGHIDLRELEAMQEFLTHKMADVTTSMVNNINNELGMVINGVQSPHDAIGKVAEITDSARWRARMVVRTELGTAYSAASQQRMSKAAQRIPDLQKRWLKSGKLHPREAHVAAHGQIQLADEPYTINGHSLRYPRDPLAPVGERVNCGCSSVPHMASWEGLIEDEDTETPAMLPSLPSPKIAQDMAGQYNQTTLMNSNYRIRPTAEDFAHQRVASPYVPHETTEAALDWARQHNLAAKIGFDENFPVEGLNPFLQSVHEHLVEFPRLREVLDYIGTNNGLLDELIAAGINPLIKVHAIGSRALATFKKPVRGVGVAIDDKESIPYILRALEQEVNESWAPPGGHTIKSTIDHEMGHMLDALLGIENDSFIQDLYEDFMKYDEHGELLSEYARTDIREFTAEAWREYRNSPAPRALALSVAERIKTRYIEEEQFPERAEKRQKRREQYKNRVSRKRIVQQEKDKTLAKRAREYHLRQETTWHEIERQEIERMNAEREKERERRLKELEERRRMIEAKPHDVDLKEIVRKQLETQRLLYEQFGIKVSITYFTYT